MGIIVEIHCDLLLIVYVCALQSSQQSNPQTVWVVPALRQLHEITRSFIKQTYQKQDKVSATWSRRTSLQKGHVTEPIFRIILLYDDIIYQCCI